MKVSIWSGFWTVFWIYLGVVSGGGFDCQAGVFSIPHLVAPSEFAIGLEPELLLSSGAAAGVNLKYSHGLSEMSNLTGILGSSGGYRGFRAGGAYSFDFFPDTESQPGVGFAMQGLFVQLPTVGSLEMTGIPYVHKTFTVEGGIPVEPFFAIPIGLSLADGSYQLSSTLVVGSLFQHNQHFRSVIEFGVALNNTTPYISGGVVYYH